jgi:uncharacterized protein (TIGR03492 family)
VRRILFVANGHGETAIAARIAHEIARLSGDDAGLDLFPLVGTGGGANGLHVVGPRRTMPSGGLVAMGNVRAFSRDVAAGFAGLLARQIAFVRGAHAYDAAIAVGDAYALAFAFGTRLPTFFVGTAKSVYVAPYGPFERMLLRSAVRIFVRDEATAVRLRSQGVRAEAPGNVIADLAGAREGAPSGRWIGVLPGSREDAYDDGLRLARVIRALGKRRAGMAALFALIDDGWIPAASEEAHSSFAFDLRDGDTRLAGWSGDLAPLLEASVVTLGQAGTANEQAAAFGVPVVALDRTAGGGRGGADWYRMRQRRLLGEALLLVPAQPQDAAASLDDPERLRAMSAAGRARMGAPGGAEAIARAILSAVA